MSREEMTDFLECLTNFQKKFIRIPFLKTVSLKPTETATEKDWIM